MMMPSPAKIRILKAPLRNIQNHQRPLTSATSTTATRSRLKMPTTKRKKTSPTTYLKS
jgi:hypothetical protein